MSSVTPKRDKEIEQYKKALGLAMDALIMYARPESYHACAFLFDRPCGDFADDFRWVKDSGYNRPMPGARARKTVKEMGRRFGGLSYYSKDIEDGI